VQNPLFPTAEVEAKEAGSVNVPLAEHQPIAVAHATESFPIDMLTTCSNAGPGKVSSSVQVTGTSGSQSDSDLTDLEANSGSDHDPLGLNTRNAQSVPLKQKHMVHDDSDLQMETEHSKSVTLKRKCKLAPCTKHQKRNLTMGLTPYSDSGSLMPLIQHYLLNNPFKGSIIAKKIITSTLVHSWGLVYKSCIGIAPQKTLKLGTFMCVH